MQSTISYIVRLWVIIHRMELLIRPLKIWEVPKILRFRKKFDYKSPLLEDGSVGVDVSPIRMILKSIWYRKRLTTFVAERDGEIVGYITMVLGKNKKFYGNIYLISTSVKDSERGQGVGSKMFKYVEDYAKTHNARRIELDVFARNEGAVRLYQKLGYEIEGRKRRVVEGPNGTDDLIFMAKLL